MSEDPAMTAVSLRLRPARVTVTLKDGRRATHACDNFRGDFTRPYEERELREKFRELAGTVLTAEGVAKVEQAVGLVVQWSSARELTALMRLHARAQRTQKCSPPHSERVPRDAVRPFLNLGSSWSLSEHIRLIRRRTRTTALIGPQPGLNYWLKEL